MNTDDIYTPLEEAKEEIKRRWEDKVLMKKVEEFLGNNIPDFLMDSPKAYLARYIATPNSEFLRFIELADQIGLEYIIPEFLEDKFSPANSVKYHLGKIFMYKGKGKKGGQRIESKTIIDFNKCNGRKICDIKTLWDESIVDFHHGLIKKKLGNIDHKILDFSGWLKKHGGTPEKFYTYFLALFLRNGILFENFLTDGEEKMFTLEKVLPSFLFIKKKFGLKPLIVRNLPKESENDIQWFCYSDIIKDHLKDKR